MVRLSRVKNKTLTAAVQSARAPVCSPYSANAPATFLRCIPYTFRINSERNPCFWFCRVMSVLLLAHWTQSYRFCIGSAINEVELLGVKAPSDKLYDPFLVEMISGEKQMVPDNVQDTRPNATAPIMQYVSSLQKYCINSWSMVII